MPTKRRKTVPPSPQPGRSISPPDHNHPTEPKTPEPAEESNPPTPFESDDEAFMAEDEESPYTMTSPSPGSDKGKQKASYSFSGGYNALKSYKGQYYSGMAVGGTHTWNYDQGVWKETKEEPDLWKIDYSTHKRRARKAPAGSGAPVGTEYHWLIVGHQHVRKIDANVYETHLTGSKYKLAFKSASAHSWSVPTVKKQREREIQLLDDAKVRVQHLPPVSDKVKVEKEEKGQTKLDWMFHAPAKRKADENESEM